MARKGELKTLCVTFALGSFECDASLQRQITRTLFDELFATGDAQLSLRHVVKSVMGDGRAKVISSGELLPSQARLLVPKSVKNYSWSC